MRARNSRADALLHTGALRPTCESMAALMQDAELLCGFDDPDVMAAVAEIARSPGALQKYAHNAKVHAHFVGWPPPGGSTLVDEVSMLRQHLTTSCVCR